MRAASTTASPGGAAAVNAPAASDEAAEDESGITPNHINMVMEHTSCTRNEAIRALRESNDDMINAVMKISGSWAPKAKENLVLLPLASKIKLP